MSRTSFIIFIALICGMFVCAFSACSRENENKWEWSARLRDGRVVTEGDLKWTQYTVIEFQKTSNTEDRIGKCEKRAKELRSTEADRYHLEEANLSSACLEEANLKEANLKKADLSRADLRKAYLRGADLSGAILKNTDLREAKGLIEIRENFKRTGYRDNERSVTYNIKIAEWEKSAQSGTLNLIKSMFNLIFFELTCEYGMKPGRPLIILMCFIPYFAFFYIFALSRRES